MLELTDEEILLAIKLAKKECLEKEKRLSGDDIERYMEKLKEEN